MRINQTNTGIPSSFHHVSAGESLGDILLRFPSSLFHTWLVLYFCSLLTDSDFNHANSALGAPVTRTLLYPDDSRPTGVSVVEVEPNGFTKFILNAPGDGPGAYPL
jgi:hypothetical protein